MTSLGSVGEQIGTGTTNALTVTKAVPAGAVVVLAGAVNTNTSVTSVSDDKDNTWSSYITSSSGAPVVKCYMVWSVLTTALAVGDEITVQLANSTAKHAMAAAAWSGLASSPVDKSSIGNATSGSSASPGATGTLAQADEVIVVAVATNQVAADTITTPSGYSLTEQLGTTSGSNDRRISLYERTVSSTATSTPSAALSSSTTWGAVLLTLKLAAAPPAGPTVTVLDVDGTTRLPATVKGVLDVDGTTLLPATLKGVVS